jgi:hypothetical protein
MVRLSARERQTFMALLEALDVPQKANCTAMECVEALLAIERKLEKNSRSDMAQADQLLSTASRSAKNAQQESGFLSRV